jgi:DNA modification methylase
MTAQSPSRPPQPGIPSPRADAACRADGTAAASGEVVIVRGDAARLPLPDGTADLIVTSPPYWQLRSYRDGGVHFPGQVGGEDSPQEYLERLWQCTAEWKRVLKPSGSLFVVLGDRYSTGNSGDSGLAEASKASWAGGGHADARAKQRSRPAGGVPPKGLLGLPWRYALGCTDRLGLILRAEIIWRKKNSLPESVTDRVRREHETILHFTARPRYYSAVDEIRQPHAPSSLARSRRAYHAGDKFSPGAPHTLNPAQFTHPAGRLPGSVWEIAASPLSVPDRVAHARCCGGRRRDGCDQGLAHYAAFPPELARRIIAGWSPPGVCTACGQGRRPVSVGEYRKHRPSGGTMSRVERGTKIPDGGAGHWGTFGTNLLHDVAITGYACACPVPGAPTRPAVVVDPFGGTGTTALVASVLGRTGITVDLSLDYCRLAAWRTRDPRERARVLALQGNPTASSGAAA